MMTTILETIFQTVPFQFIISTAINIIPISSPPVRMRQAKNVTSSYRNLPHTKDLLENTNSLLVIHAKITATTQAIIVEIIFGTYNLL